METYNLADDNTNINIKTFILDPLSVIVKLAIIGNKPIGTKILIQNNVISFQEPGYFQGISRIFYKSNKTDIQYLYNPIYIACFTFLSNEYLKENNTRIKSLFGCAQKGIKKLMETYKSCSIINLVLTYYYTIITYFIENEPVTNIYQKDGMSILYTTELKKTLNDQWTKEKIKIILDLITFLNNDTMANENVKSLENIISSIDKTSQDIIHKI
jgi:hypothetical protein